MRKSIIVLQAISFIYILITPFSTALGVSTGTGNLDINFGIDYDSSTIEAFWDNHIIESWNHGEITSRGYDSEGNYSSTIFADDNSAPYYDNLRNPLWDHTPENMNLAYNESSVIANFDHSNISNPRIHSTVHMSTAGVPNPSFNNTSMNDFNYYSEFRATGTGQFTAYLEYGGSWSGVTTALSDTLYLIGSAELRITDVLIKENSFLGYGDDLFSEHVYKSLPLEDVQSDSFDDFFGRLEFKVDYVAGDMFSLLYSARNEVMGTSEEVIPPSSAPVPEPSTILLLGSGLAGLAFHRRKKK